MNINGLNIGNLHAKLPIIQGGMGIGVSLSSLSSAVANEGGIGIISAAQIGFREPDFKTNNLEANKRALIKEIRKARELSPKGIIGVNILHAASSYKDLVKTAVDEKIDLIIVGAGLPIELPELTLGSQTKIVPIVSSGKAAALISRAWDKRYSYAPDAVIVEGPKAGGHLGFNKDELNRKPEIKLEDIVLDVIKSLKPYESKYNKNIPVIAAGGIFTGKDIAKYLKIGASGVQMATRFVATHECDADIKFKEAYINAKEEDIKIIKSPVGLLGRAVQNDFLENYSENEINYCYNCLKNCSPKTAPYCITKALISAVSGDVENGLIFAGSNVYKVNKIMSVKELINELLAEIEQC